MEKSMNIQYVNHSIGNNFGEVIELNENLKKYPKLHKAILEHELKHSCHNFSTYDLKHDLRPSKVSLVDMTSFIIRYPKSLYQFRPFYYSKKWGFVYDANLIIVYLVVFGVILASVYYGFKF